ncbi:MAG: beta-galactosidase [Candidatus Sumerlaeota bacterium]|nr:beta-galactosidase [Candidatus Sumerlaeota bacterium]
MISPLIVSLGVSFLSAATGSSDSSQPASKPDIPAPMTGLTWMSGKMSDGQAWVDGIEKTLSENPHLSGVFLGGQWDSLEPRQGRFEWSTLDAGIEVVRRHGLFYKIVLKPGSNTPQWVYDLGAQTFETLGTNPYRKDTYNKPQIIPIPWDPIFLREFERFVRAAGERYSADPRCAAVTVTGANFASNEMHLPKKAPGDQEKWAALGFRDKLIEAYKTYIDLFGEAFPRQQLCLHISSVVREDDGIPQAAVAYGAEKYPDRFTLQNCQLSGKGANTNLFSYRVIEPYIGRLHVGYQSLALLGGERQGDSQVSVYNFVRGQGEYWELWQGNGKDPKICQWLIDEIARARKMGPDAYRAELESKGLLSKKAE